jgi:hypothetical protein
MVKSDDKSGAYREMVRFYPISAYQDNHSNPNELKAWPQINSCAMS